MQSAFRGTVCPTQNVTQIHQVTPQQGATTTPNFTKLNFLQITPIPNLRQIRKTVHLYTLRYGQTTDEQAQQFHIKGGEVYGVATLVPELAGSNPAEAVGFFGCPNNLRRGSERICPMSQLCGM